MYVALLSLKTLPNTKIAVSIKNIRIAKLDIENVKRVEKLVLTYGWVWDKVILTFPKMENHKCVKVMLTFLRMENHKCIKVMLTLSKIR